MISQDCHEVYIIIAEYDNDYIEYLKTGKHHDRVFMTMHEFGPFEPTSVNHMKFLGLYFQSFTLNLLKKAHKGDLFRW